MDSPAYIIRNRFQVYPELHLIRDNFSDVDTKLEPRLMQVLELLVKDAGSLVSREVLIREVWDNYGGAGEALNHAVALLRKILQDTEKDLIRTVPKKGYTIGTIISYPVSASPIRSKILFAVGMAVVLGVLAGFWWYAKPASEKKVSYEKVSNAPEETVENTIETSAPDGTQYKLISIGDGPPSFYINGRLQVPDSMEKHRLLIHQLKHELSLRRKSKRN
ncbi:MAG: winged helix-turn-helix domain-containing protein [Sphingobacteriaceae bacterium]|nr:winged helix-turn-helix domain-containing protein [Sphingobacteriaceae bacterium]